jgi:hypothetical protein
MTAPIGFVLLTHANPAQSLRLVRRLSAIFADPPIACHHDFSQCQLNASEFPTNVDFVRPYVRTRWADRSVVEATCRALNLLYSSTNSPDWFVLLSGADYPIRPAERVLADLNNGGGDAYVRHKLVDPSAYRTDFDRRCVRWYLSKRIWIPGCTRRLRPAWKAITLSSPWLLRRFGPYSDTFRCYYGGQWFCGNRRAAEVIALFRQTDRRLIRHCRHVLFPDEMYFSTVLANAENLSVRDQNFRYVDWSAGGPHPKLLGEEDLPALASSGCHFARKLPWNERLLDQLDRLSTGVPG